LWALRVFADICRSFAEHCGIFAGYFQRFRGQLFFAQLNPQTLKNTLDIQLPFQKQGVVGVSDV
jgi:hypothetical protein